MPSETDPTPFKTRSHLLSVYGSQVKAVWNNCESYPVQVEVNLSGDCNQRCRWCISESAHAHSRLDLRKPGVRRFFEDFKRLGGRAVGWSGGGEPTNHPDFPDALEMVAAAGLRQGVLTHGAFAEKLVAAIAERCDWVRVSIDTHDQTEYCARRGAHPKMFDLVLRNVRGLVQTRKIRVGLNMNVSEWNRGHMQGLFDLARELKVAYLQVRPTLPLPASMPVGDDYLRPASVSDVLRGLSMVEARWRPGDPELIVSEDKFADLRPPRYGRDDEDWGYKGCESHRLFVILNYTGKLVVCMYHLDDERFTFGSVYDSTLEELWQSDKRREVLRFCKDDLDHVVHKCQACCKGHEINKILLSDQGRALGVGPLAPESNVQFL